MAGQANLNDRASVEALYPRADFDRDAASNSRGKAVVLHGLMILSEPDASGSFRAGRAHRQVGEVDPGDGTVFLPPFMGEDLGALRQTDVYGGEEEAGDGLAKVERSARDYERFIDMVVERARTVRFPEAPGRGEERLKGFRGG